MFSYQRENLKGTHVNIKNINIFLTTTIGLKQ